MTIDNYVKKYRVRIISCEKQEENEDYKVTMIRYNNSRVRTMTIIYTLKDEPVINNILLDVIQQTKFCKNFLESTKPTRETKFVRKEVKTIYDKYRRFFLNTLEEAINI